MITESARIYEVKLDDLVTLVGNGIWGEKVESIIDRMYENQPEVSDGVVTFRYELASDSIVLTSKEVLDDFVYRINEDWEYEKE